MENLDITKYLDMVLRRKWWIIIPFLLTVLAGLSYALITPRIYEAQTLILVQPQKVPGEFVRAIVSSDVEDRLRTITQQVTSRTNLERIIEEYQLYSKPTKNNLLLEAKVGLFRKSVEIVVSKGARGGKAFTISFRGRNPEKVMQVTNNLASSFISENLKIRESHVLGTSAFLADELESVRKRLAEKEARLKEYRQKYMGGMPEHIQTNLRILDRLQDELAQLNNTMQDVQNRKLILQNQIAEAEIMQKQMSGLEGGNSLIEFDSSSGTGDVGSEELRALKKKLILLESRYTANHPDVRRTKNMIAKLESKETEQETESDESEVESAEVAPVFPMGENFLKPQLQQIDLEIRNLKNEIRKVQAKGASYQKKVEDTPKREQELISLNRDYDNLKKLYDSLLNRKLEAEIAVSMEKKQKGEQFRVIDPAKIPIRPIEPDVRKIILITLVLGLGLGGGLAYLVETMDTSYKTPDDIEKELDIPILISMPIRYTDRELRRMKRKQIMAYASVGVGFVLSAIGIVLAVKGVDTTINYVKSIFDKM
ncbi:MAG: protein GumC [Deltaproteobacteria bacterium]|nr:protein GumC [Deltaproteobacteria bacterium]